MKNSQLQRFAASTPSLFDDIFDDSFFAPHDILMDKVFGKMFPNTAQELGTSLFESRAYPKVDIRETDNEFILEAEVPGLDKNQVKVDVKVDTLIIRGDKRDETKKEGKYNVREIKRSSFVRSFLLPPEVVNKDSIKAKFQDGILEIVVQKVKPTPPPAPVVKSVEIQ
jgi:HSP20 family protein